MVDEYTGGRVPLDIGDRVLLDIGDVDLLSHSVVSNILSLGKLLRGGFDFHLTDRGRRCYAVTPGGAHKLKVSLGVDDILRLRHSLRTGSDRVRITQPSGVCQLSRRAHDATSSFLHDVFNHASDEKIYRTLGVTKGYKQVRLKPCHCNTCARSFGLKHKSTVGLIQPLIAAGLQPSDIFDDDTSDDNGSDSDDAPDDGYRADVAGRELGIQPVP